MSHDLAKLITKDESNDYYDLSVEEECCIWGTKNKTYILSTDGLSVKFKPTQTGKGSTDFVVHEDGAKDYGFWIRKNDKFVSCRYDDEWANIDVSYNYLAKYKSARK